MTGTQISNLLATQDVIIATNDANRPLQHGDIFVFPLTNITWGSGTSLTLSAHRDINIIGGAVIKNTAAGHLVLRADSGGTGTGTVNLLPLARVDFSKSTGTVSIYYNPRGEADKYRHATNYSCSGLCLSGGVLTQQSSQLTAYMLVNSADDLNAYAGLTTSDGSYALGKNFALLDSPDFHSYHEFLRTVRRPGSDHRQPDHRAEQRDHPQCRAVRRHRPRRRRAEPQPDECQRDRQPGRRVPDRGTLAGTNQGTVSGVIATGGVNGGTVAGATTGRSRRQQLRHDPVIGRAREHSGGRWQHRRRARRHQSGADFGARRRAAQVGSAASSRTCRPGGRRAVAIPAQFSRRSARRDRASR